MVAPAYLRGNTYTDWDPRAFYMLATVARCNVLDNEDTLPFLLNAPGVEAAELWYRDPLQFINGHAIRYSDTLIIAFSGTRNGVIFPSAQLMALPVLSDYTRAGYNGFFASIAAACMEDLRRLIGNFAGQHVISVGHSLGAICGLIAMSDIRNEFPGKTYTHVSLGSPRGIENFISQALPIRHFNIQNQGDFVPSLPFQRSISQINGFLRKPLKAISLTLDYITRQYVHHGFLMQLVRTPEDHVVTYHGQAYPWIHGREFLANAMPIAASHFEFRPPWEQHFVPTYAFRMRRLVNVTTEDIPYWDHVNEVMNRRENALWLIGNYPAGLFEIPPGIPGLPPVPAAAQETDSIVSAAQWQEVYRRWLYQGGGGVGVQLNNNPVPRVATWTGQPLDKLVIRLAKSNPAAAPTMTVEMIQECDYEGYQPWECSRLNTSVDWTAPDAFTHEAFVKFLPPKKGPSQLAYGVYVTIGEGEDQGLFHVHRFGAPIRMVRGGGTLYLRAAISAMVYGAGEPES